MGVFFLLCKFKLNMPHFTHYYEPKKNEIKWNEMKCTIYVNTKNDIESHKKRSKQSAIK